MWKEKDGVATIVYYGKLWRIKEERNGLRTRDELGSQLRIGKVLAPHNSYSKTVPLIEWVKSNVIY